MSRSHSGMNHIMMISETKLDNTVPNVQFSIDRFNESIRQDRNKNGEGILFFIRKDIPTKALPFETPLIAGFFIGINFYKKNWLLCCSYNPDNSNIKNHHSALSVNLDI